MCISSTTSRVTPCSIEDNFQAERCANTPNRAMESDYNRERVDSSGKQQLVERSISNYWFTVDRQPGGR